MRKTIIVSDFSGDAIDDAEIVQITLRFADRRRGVYVAEAHPDDPIVRQVVSSGRKQQTRGRKPQGDGLGEALAGQIHRAGGRSRAAVTS